MYCYLDNSATTPALDSIKAVVEQYFDCGFITPHLCMRLQLR